jgi:retron-type reverse transcriptase
MKEAIRMVPESIYDPEFPDTSHFRSGRGCHSALRRIKEEWGTSRWFLEFDIRKCFHTIDRHRFISILKEEIDDSKFFYPTQKQFSAGRLVGGEKGPDSIPNSVLLSALPGNIYLHKLDQEIGRISFVFMLAISDVNEAGRLPFLRVLTFPHIHHFLIVNTQLLGQRLSVQRVLCEEALLAILHNFTKTDSHVECTYNSTKDIESRLAREMSTKNI